MNWIILHFEPALMAAITAVAFAVLFGVHKRTLLPIAILGATGVLLRIVMTGMTLSLIEASFISAAVVGLGSLWLSWRYHAPAIVFSLPSVIPMVPGIYAYRTMLGMLAFTRNTSLTEFQLIEIINNGLITLLVFLCLSIGVCLPNILLRGNSIRELYGIPKRQKRAQKCAAKPDLKG